MSLLLALAKDAVLRKVGDRVKKLDRAYVVRWLEGDLWIADTLGRTYAREMRAWRETVRETLDAITPGELLAACRQARPDLADLWDTQAARAKIEAERERGRAIVERLEEYA